MSPERARSGVDVVGHADVAVADVAEFVVDEATALEQLLRAHGRPPGRGDVTSRKRTQRACR